MLIFTLTKILPIFYSYLRPFIKWFLHQFTRLCELQRLCYGAKPGASRTLQVENSLTLSKQIPIKLMIQEFDDQMEFCNDEEFKNFINQAINIILQVKKIKPRYHPDFPRLFGQCVEKIWGYRRLMYHLENLRRVQYDSENVQHEKQLLKLWNLLMPDIPLHGRISKQWQEIGFQGDDPKTDFRGMGMLGLENLLYFVTEYNCAARHVLSHSMHPKYGYTFAIVGINLTSMAYKMFKSGEAKTHFYNVSNTAITLKHFHQFYCYLIFEFDRFWVENKPQNIMEFPLLHQRFSTNISIELSNNKTVFKTNLIVDNI